MVKIPIGNGSKNVTLMVVYAHPRRGKEANARNEHIFDAVVGLAAGLGETPLMICGDLQPEPGRQSRRLDFALSRGWLTDLGQTHKPAGAAQPLHTYEQGDTKTLGLCTGQRGLPRGSGRLRGGAAESRTQAQRAQDHADPGHLPEHTFRNKWKQASHEYEQAIMEARSSNQRRRKSEAMSKAWRVITGAFVQSMLIYTPQKPEYVQYKGKTPKFFQTTVGGFTKPGKIGKVALQVRQLQNWANKIAGCRDEWKKEERANQQSGRIAEHPRRCDRTRWEMLMTRGHHWLDP